MMTLGRRKWLERDFCREREQIVHRLFDFGGQRSKPATRVNPASVADGGRPSCVIIFFPLAPPAAASPRAIHYPDPYVCFVAFAFV